MVKELKEYRRWAWNCFRDSTCKHVFTWHLKNAAYDNICPALTRYQFDCYSAQGKMGELARCLIEGEIEWSDKLLEVIYNDPICGACSYNCGRVTEMNPSDVIQAMRAQALKDGQTPPGGFKEFLDNLRQYHNPYQKQDADRAKWVARLPKKLQESATDTKTKTKVLLYVGCTPLRDANAAKVAQDAATVLIKAGVDVGVLGERERCCGHPALKMGDTDEFNAYAKENIQMFNDMGIEKLVVTCPLCYSTFKRDYPNVGMKMNFEVVHILPMVAELIAKGQLKLTKPVNMTATYHDPCHLGRLSDFGITGTDDVSGIYKEPRQIIEAIPGLSFVEMFRTKDDAWCCGAGSWLRHGALDMARWTADERIKEAEASGAQALLTYCPHCEENLTEAAGRGQGGMQVYDLLDLVLKAI